MWPWLPGALPRLGHRISRTGPLGSFFDAKGDKPDLRTDAGSVGAFAEQADAKRAVQGKC